MVQKRPQLGSLHGRRSAGRWLAPAVDFGSSSIALATVALPLNSHVFPALPVAPLLLVAVNGILGMYSARPRRRALAGDERIARPVARLLLAPLFTWSASLLTPTKSGAQLAVVALFIIIDAAGQAICAPLSSRLDRVDRWVLVGDESTARRLRAYKPLRAYAKVVRTLRPPAHDLSPADRMAALDVVDHCHADRVVIASQAADEKSMVDLVGAFKSIGVPVSLLPRPLDLLEAAATTPSLVGGVPLINVEALVPRNGVRYSGPCRRTKRRTMVSVVIPAMNEARNIAHVLSQLPEGLHEVILVDGNSHDNTAAVAWQAYPGIRILTQNGSGKGDALRTGFAAVTGNLVVMIDADGSADPAEIPRFVQALEAGADFAKGSRFIEGGGSADITITRRLGNSLLSGATNLLYGTRFTDLCYGYNAFWTRCLPFISLDVPGFEVETLINLRIASAGMKITEVPSYEAARMFGHSSLNAFRDGFRVLGVILHEAHRWRTLRGRWRLVPRPERAREAGRAIA